MDWRRQYEAMSSGAGCADLSAWAKLRFTGSDRKKFLNGLLTNDVAKLEPQRGMPVCLLTPKGRLQAFFLLYDLGESLLALCPPESAGNLAAAIGKVIVLSSTRMEDATSRSGLLYIAGPAADSVLGSVLGALQALSPYQARTAARGGEEILILSYPRLRGDGRLVMFPKSQGEELLRSLEKAGAAAVGPEAFNVLRVEAGLPWFGVDMDDDTIPQEARLEEAISFTKGCYMGQETISRVHHMGHVNKILVGLKVSGEQPPPPGSPVFSGETEIGRVTSAVASPRLGAILALGTIRVEYAKPGARLEVGSGTAGMAATAIDLPVPGL